MSLTIHTTNDIAEPARFIVASLIQQLSSGKKVLFFVTGGSSVKVGARVSELLKEAVMKNETLLQNLTVTLTDERYGAVGHRDSNWQQLLEQGFSLPGAKLIPILTGDNRELTTEKFNAALKAECAAAEYMIGLFGIGSDGHTAGMLPGSVALEATEFACGYDTPTFSRITITPIVIKEFDEVVVFAQGQEKWNVIENLEKDIDSKTQPAQLLKQAPLLTIFTDYKNNK